MRLNFWAFAAVAVVALAAAGAFKGAAGFSFSTPFFSVGGNVGSKE